MPRTPSDRPPLPSNVLARIVAAAEQAWRRGDGCVIVQVSTKPDASRHASVKVLAPDVPGADLADHPGAS